jgi:dipeptidyl-peptidase-4
VTLYPLVVALPTEPDSRQVTEEWGASLATFLASGEKVAVLAVAGRGAGGQGLLWRDALNRGIGRADVSEQLEAVRAVLATHPFLDPARVAVLGQGYGGFLAAAMLADRSAQ